MSMEKKPYRYSEKILACIPYMGSKRAIAKQLVDYIIQNNPNAKYFYDLFGGGGAISFELLKRGKKVVYNELNTGVVELLKKIREEGVTKEFYKWVSREEFGAHKNDNDWHGGLLKTCWSFGNNQKNYLFGAKIEEDKRLLHEIVVNRCDKSRKAFKQKYGLDIEESYLISDDIQKRRLAVMQLVKKYIGRNGIQGLERIQQLQQLQQLGRLERLERLEQLEILNKSYLDVDIITPIDETVIYLDPPYKGTATYQEEICHLELISYIKKSSYKIYVSSYNFDLPEVFSVYKRCTFHSTSEGNKVVEKLFCNRAETRQTALF